jgi:hypothetical protein
MLHEGMIVPSLAMTIRTLDVWRALEIRCSPSPFPLERTGRRIGVVGSYAVAIVATCSARAMSVRWSSGLADPSGLVQCIGKAARSVDLVTDRGIEADDHIQQRPYSGCDTCPAEYCTAEMH